MGEGTITQRNDQAKDKKTRCHFEIRRITRGLFFTRRGGGGHFCKDFVEEHWFCV